MKKIEFMNTLTQKFNRVGLSIKKHSPEILIAAGVVGTVTSAVMACKATTKVEGIMEKAKKDVDFMHECGDQGYVKDPSNGELVPYSEEDLKKDLTITYVKTGVELVKLYAPAIALGALSLTAIVSSHNILRKRNIALATAYTTVNTAFKEYRGRVVERFGKELDRELRYNIKAKEVEETVIDENGEEKTITKTVDVLDPNTLGMFTRVFDDGNPGWDKNPELTMFYLKQQQSYANEKLKAQGHLFLNEVLKMLGYPLTPTGNLFGWIYDEKNPIGDNFVDFGLYNIDNPKVRDFMNGYEKAILLEFNCDGYILDEFA